MSTKKSAVSGFFWALMDALFIKGFALVSTVILTAVLSPDDFGLIGMITIFVMIGASLVESGMTSSLIRTKDADDTDYSTVFFVNLITGTVLYIIIYFCAPLIATYFKQEILISIVRWYCLTFILSAFSSVQLTLMTARMEFKKITALNFPSAILAPIIGITLGYKGYGVWSLVVMFLSYQVMQTGMFWVFSRWKPSFVFSMEKAKYHYSFGYKLMFSGILNTVFTYIYNVIIGRYYSLSTLGYFDRASRYNEFPINILTTMVSKVTYPLLANIKDNRAELANVYRKILGLSFWIAAPLMLGLSAVAHPLFLALFGEKWLAAVPYFQILSLASIFYPIHSINLNVLKVYGRTDLFFRLEVIKKIIAVVVIAVCWQFGLMGLVWSGVIVSIVSLLINTHYSADMIGYSTRRQLLDMLPTLLLSAVMCGVIFLITTLMQDTSPILQVFVSFIAAIVFYFGVNFVLKTPSFVFMRQLIKEYRP